MKFFAYSEYYLFIACYHQVRSAKIGLCRGLFLFNQTKLSLNLFKSFLFLGVDRFICFDFLIETIKVTDCFFGTTLKFIQVVQNVGFHSFCAVENCYKQVLR